MTGKPAARLWPAALEGLASLAGMTDPSESERLKKALSDEIEALERAAGYIKKSAVDEKSAPVKAAARQARPFRVQFGGASEPPARGPGELILIGDLSDDAWLSEQMERHEPRRFFLRLVAPPQRNSALGVYEVREVQPAPADSFDPEPGDVLVVGARPSEADPALVEGQVGLIFDCDDVIVFANS